jgi:mRNA-degrading endonuclease RelE of RelBE toxin-antitoxin system
VYQKKISKTRKKLKNPTNISKKKSSRPKVSKLRIGKKVVFYICDDNKIGLDVFNIKLTIKE